MEIVAVAHGVDATTSGDDAHEPVSALLTASRALVGVSAHPWPISRTRSRSPSSAPWWFWKATATLT